MQYNLIAIRVLHKSTADLFKSQAKWFLFNFQFEHELDSKINKDEL